MNKVEEFIYLQNTINNQIDQYGEAQQELINQLDELLNKLTVEEEEEIIKIYLNS